VPYGTTPLPTPPHKGEGVLCIGAVLDRARGWASVASRA
jgi:hypothetical protein